VIVVKGRFYKNCVDTLSGWVMMETSIKWRVGMYTFIAGMVFGFLVLITTMIFDGSVDNVRLGKQPQEVIAQCEKSIPRYMTCKITAEIKEAE
jgi:hypothetical protein